MSHNEGLLKFHQSGIVTAILHVLSRWRQTKILLFKCWQLICRIPANHVYASTQGTKDTQRWTSEVPYCFGN